MKKIVFVLIIVTFQLIVIILSFNFGKKFEKSDSQDLVIDFKSKDVIGYDLKLKCAVELFYQYRLENENCHNYKNYFDTLTYFKKNLWIYYLDYNNYLVLYKKLNNNSFDSLIYGFSKDKFYVFRREEVIIKNFPIQNLHRGTPR
jgi:hypothetical protein